MFFVDQSISPTVELSLCSFGNGIVQDPRAGSLTTVNLLKAREKRFSAPLIFTKGKIDEAISSHPGGFFKIPPKTQPDGSFLLGPWEPKSSGVPACLSCLFQVPLHILEAAETGYISWRQCFGELNESKRSGMTLLCRLKLWNW